MDDERKDDQIIEDEDLDSDSGSVDDDAPPQDGKGTKDSATSDKRVNDLMGKWQAEQAANAKLKAELDALKGQGTSNGGEPKPDAGAANEFLELAREQARQSLFSSDPRFAQMGLEISAIEGNSAKEMQASVARLRSLLDKVEGSARTKVLREHGLDPEISGGGSRDKQKPPSEMTDKEITEMADRALGRL